MEEHNPTLEAPDPLNRAARLRRMKAVPLVMLAVMIIVIIYAHYFLAGSFQGYLIAFCEAAIVGGLADWFAVTALFRHPMGIPIPHTAIIPHRKDELADSLADFVQTHFINPDNLREHLDDIDLAAAIAWWALHRRDKLADAINRFSRFVLTALADDEYRTFLHDRLITRLDMAQIAPVAGRLLHLAADNRHHQALLTQVIRLAAAFLDENRDRIQDQIRRGSPWWLPSIVDEKIYDQMVERIQTQMLAMVLDPDHELRQEFDLAIKKLAVNLTESDETRAYLSEMTENIATDETFRAYLAELFDQGATLFLESLEEPKNPWRNAVRATIGRLAVGALRDDSLRVRFNDWLREAIVYTVQLQGGALTGIISATVRRWDGKETARHIELQVGRDLQFIRINGTLVGGLIGLLIHLISQLAS